MSYLYAPVYPTLQHERSAQAVTRFFSGQPGISAVLLTCSCARGRASPDSCLDITVLLAANLPEADRQVVEQAWQVYHAAEPVFSEQRRVGLFSQVDLDFHPGEFDPGRFAHSWTSGADAFELEVGNLLAYSVPLWQGDTHYTGLRAQWLPYYAEELRRQRLSMVLGYCRNNLAHIPPYVGRGLYFQAFKRLYQAFEEFLQALFIARRTYPIAYDKHIREQIVEILALPELYPQLVALLETRSLESDELAQKAKDLEALIVMYLDSPPLRGT